jgi:hypothetical protein
VPHLRRSVSLQSFPSTCPFSAQARLGPCWARLCRASGAGVTRFRYFGFPRKKRCVILCWLTRHSNGVDPSPPPPQNAQHRRVVGAPGWGLAEARPRVRDGTQERGESVERIAAIPPQQTNGSGRSLFSARGKRTFTTEDTKEHREQNRRNSTPASQNRAYWGPRIAKK